MVKKYNTMNEKNHLENLYDVYLYCPSIDSAKVCTVEATHYTNAKTKALDMYPGYVLLEDQLSTQC
tara:strand:+ start:4690 stop:4887 length:198 start_codon:yes stop_codon:yes gene_type:complete